MILSYIRTYRIVLVFNDTLFCELWIFLYASFIHSDGKWKGNNMPDGINVKYII